MALARSTARRYAEAAFEIAERDDSMEAWMAAFTVAEERLSDARVTRLLANPAVPSASRVAVLERIVGDDVSGAPRSLLALMVRRGRFELLPAVIREFRRLYRLREGIVEATVTSASALDATGLEALQERLEALTAAQGRATRGSRPRPARWHQRPRRRPAHRRLRPRSPGATPHRILEHRYLTPPPSKEHAWPSAPTTSPRSSSPPSTSSIRAWRRVRSAPSWKSVTASPASMASKTPSPPSCWSSPAGSRGWP